MTLAASPDLAPMLSGLRVLEIGHFVAAPFCTRLLADLGADVIKIEPIAGDPVRKWGAQVDGASLWWSVHGRNKRSVAMDLKSEEAKGLLLDLVESCDVVVENFRPGQLERLGLGPDALRARRPGLIIASISGYGQDGPYRNRAAFGVIGEAMGGLRYLTNDAPGDHDRPPVRVGVSIGDSIAGLYAAFGVMAALWARDKPGGDGAGRTLDVALTESVFSMMEAMLPEYGALGRVKRPTGGAIATAAPSNAYPTADGDWVLIAANSDPLFAKLAALMHQPELATDARFIDNRARVANAVDLDTLISDWSQQTGAPELLARLEAADVPACKVYTAADCAADEQFRFRGMVREVADPLFGSVLHTGIVPRVVGTAADIRWPGPSIGAHTDQVLTDVAGLSADRIATLRERGVVA